MKIIYDKILFIFSKNNENLPEKPYSESCMLNPRKSPVVWRRRLTISSFQISTLKIQKCQKFIMQTMTTLYYVYYLLHNIENRIPKCNVVQNYNEKTASRLCNFCALLHVLFNPRPTFFLLSCEHFTALWILQI